MANYQFAADLLLDVLSRCGLATDNTAPEQPVALRYLNRGYFGLVMGGSELEPGVHEDWWWLRRTRPLTLNWSLACGAVQVTNNSAAIKFSAAIATSLASWHFKVDAHEDVFRVQTHAGGATGATLSSVYTGSSATGAAWRAHRLEYPLATGVLRLMSPMRGFRSEGDYQVHGMDLEALERAAPVGRVQWGVPRRFAMVGERTVRFDRSGGATSGDLMRLEYDYLELPAPLTSGAVEPVVPWQWRRVLSDWATTWVMLDLNDDRADGVGLAAKGGLRAMARENRHKLAGFSGLGFGVIRPRRDQAEDRGPLRTAGGLIIG